MRLFEELLIHIDGVIGLENRKAVRVFASPSKAHFLTPASRAKGVDHAGSERDIGKEWPVEVPDNFRGITGRSFPLNGRGDLCLSILG